MDSVTIDNVNGAFKINISPFETEESLITKIAAKKGLYRGVYTIPKFISIIPGEKSKKSSAKEEQNLSSEYNYVDVRDVLYGITLSELYSKQSSILLSKFPEIKSNELISLWLTIQGYNDVDEKKFISGPYQIIKSELTILFYSKPSTRYGSAQAILSALKEYYKTTKASYDEITRIIKDSNIFEAQFKKSPIVKITPFEVKKTNEETVVNLPNGETMYEIFDALVVSEKVPFAVLRVMGVEFYKVHDSISPPESWITHIPEENDTHEGFIHGTIFICVLGVDMDTLLRKGPLTEFYNFGVWYIRKEGINSVLTHYIDLSYSTDLQLNSKAIKNRVISSFKSIQIEEIKINQTKIKGVCTLVDVEYNRAALCDLITNDDVFSYFLFIDEREKSSLNKGKFYLYFATNPVKSVLSSLSLLLTPSIKEAGKVEMRISNARTMSEVTSFINVFSRIYGLFTTKMQDTIDKYIKLFPDTSKLFPKYGYEKREKIKNVKTGSRLQNLKSFKPEVFDGKGYSGVCFQNRQPYAFKTEEKERVKKILKSAEIPNLEKQGMLNWPEGSDDWYACYPREEKDVDKKHIWPGLKHKSTLDENYSEFPYAPCCYIVNQLSKKKGGLVSHKNATDFNEKDTGEKDAKGNDNNLMIRPVDSRKLVARGKLGKIPYYVQIAAEAAGYTYTNVKGKYTMPLLRLGVVEGPTSFIHCFEAAFQKDYLSKPLKQKISDVDGVLLDITRNSDDYFVVCRQQLYDYSCEEIRTHLLEDGAYIDPDVYVNLFSKHYNCNVIMLKVDDEHQDGDISYPRSNGVYLPYKITPNLETLIIIKTKIDRPWKYQCELVGEVKALSGSTLSSAINFQFNESDGIVRILNKISAECNKVYSISPEGRYSLYTPAAYI